jgi:NADH:ubiquinone oxidoreductase subunit 4 (subunit M)
LTTALIVLPLVAGLLVWLLPLNRVSAGSLALLAALAEIGLWIQLVARFDFGASGLQFSNRWSWFNDLGVSYYVGVNRF